MRIVFVLPVSKVVWDASIFLDGHGVCLDGALQVANGEHFVAKVFALLVRQVLQVGTWPCSFLFAGHDFQLSSGHQRSLFLPLALETMSRYAESVLKCKIAHFS